MTFDKPFNSIILIFFIGLSVAGCVAPTPRSDQPLVRLGISEVVDAGVNGEAVRWGGTIIQVENLADGTSVEIVSRPLSSWGRPLRNDKSDGRFIAQLNQFLDPAIVKEGMDVTLVGVLSDIKEGKIGQTPYKFPVLKVDNFKLWRPQRSSVPYAHGFWRDPLWQEWPQHPNRSINRVEGRFAF